MYLWSVPVLHLSLPYLHLTLEEAGVFVEMCSVRLGITEERPDLLRRVLPPFPAGLLPSGVFLLVLARLGCLPFHPGEHCVAGVTGLCMGL